MISGHPTFCEIIFFLKTLLIHLKWREMRLKVIFGENIANFAKQEMARNVIKIWWLL